MTGAQKLVRALEELGVAASSGCRAIATVCPSMTPLLTSARSGVLVRHEQGTPATPPRGYAMVPAVQVCVATSGPGKPTSSRPSLTHTHGLVPILAICGSEVDGIGTDTSGGRHCRCRCPSSSIPSSLPVPRTSGPRGWGVHIASAGLPRTLSSLISPRTPQEATEFDVAPGGTYRLSSARQAQPAASGSSRRVIAMPTVPSSTSAVAEPCAQVPSTT